MAAPWEPGVNAVVPARARTVLVIDAHPRNREAEARSLRAAGFEVIEARAGTDALRIAAERRPSLVLVGADLPDIGGFELCCRLKAAPETALIPAIHIASPALPPGELPRSLRQEAYALLEAPVPPRTLSAIASAMILGMEAEQRRREFEARVQQSEHRASEILERIADPVVAYDRGFRYTYVSRRTAQSLGKTPEEMLGRSIFEVFPEIAGAGLEEASARAWKEGRPVVLERFSPLAGRWIENFIYPFEDGAVAQWHDISERKRAEEALRESEARLARAEEFSLVMPLHISLEGAFLKVPPTFVRFLGFDREDELLGKSFRDVTHPDDIQPEWEQIARLLSGEIKSFEMEKRFIRRDGSATWGDMNCTVVADTGGKPVYLLKYIRDINKRKRAEAALRESEANALNRLAEIEAIYESSPVGLALLDTQLRFIRVNRRFAQMNGWPAEAHIGRTVADLNPQFEAFAAEAVRRVLQTGEPLLDLEITGSDPAGSGLQRTWNEHWVPVRDERGRIVSVSVAVEDITGRKHVTEELERQKRQYEALAENAPEAIVRFDRELRHIYINNYGARFYQRDKSEIVWKTPAELGVPPDRVEFWRARFEQVFATGKQQTIDYESPGHKFFSSLLVPEFDAGGHIASVLAITRDITGLKRAEEELRQSRDLLAFAMENAGAGSFDLDLATGRLEWSSELRKLHDVGPDEPVTFDSWIDGILPEDRERVRADMAVARDAGEGVTQFRIRRRDGEIRWLEGRGRALRDENGVPVRIIGVSIDITQQKRAEEALSDRERQLRELADGMPQLVWINDAAGHAIYVNRQWYEQTGFPPDKPLDAWPDLLHPDDRERCFEYWRRCLATGELYQMEYRLQAPAGGYRWYLARAVPVHDPQGRIARWFGTCTDIDESKRAEERLRQTQKLESIGLLAGGIAHDFNNLLTGILGNASLVVDDVDPVSAERIREVINSAERAAHLTRQLLAYSGKGHFFARELDLSQAVNEMSDLMQFSLPKSVDLSVHFQRRLPLVRIDPSQLQQVVMNLVINAGEAIGEGNTGRVTVATSLAEVAGPFVDATGQNIPAGRYVAVEVTDTGPGMDREALSRIFDPFFTTKFTGRGLGLAAVAGIVRSQGGAITVDSAPGRGAAFRVLFRAADRRAEPGPRGTILVVDDEASVRAFIGAVLRRKGYRVLEASDGREALAIFDREKGAIEGVVLDVVMPVMGANELLPLLKARKPNIAILLTSGYSEAEARRLSAAYPGAAFIQKPYTARQILKALQQSMYPENR
jgi:PAS domain S-box-containing protein